MTDNNNTTTNTFGLKDLAEGDIVFFKNSPPATACGWTSDGGRFFSRSEFGEYKVSDFYLTAADFAETFDADTTVRVRSILNEKEAPNPILDYNGGYVKLEKGDLLFFKEDRPAIYEGRSPKDQGTSVFTTVLDDRGTIRPPEDGIWDLVGFQKELDRQLTQRVKDLVAHLAFRQ